MKAQVSYRGGIIVKGSEMLKGRGIKFLNVASNGEYKFLLTERAYQKISHKCTFDCDSMN